MNSKIIFRSHSVRRMFERNITEEDVIKVLRVGKIIENYPNDTPYPSYLKLGFTKGRALHVVIANNSEENEFIIITVYEPDLIQWEVGFERRKKL